MPPPNNNNITSLLVVFLVTDPSHISMVAPESLSPSLILKSPASAVTGLGHEPPMPLALQSGNNGGTCPLHRLPATVVWRRWQRACPPRPHRPPAPARGPVTVRPAQLTPGRGTTTTTFRRLSHLVLLLLLLVQRHQKPAAAPAPAEPTFPPLSSKFLPVLHSS